MNFQGIYSLSFVLSKILVQKPSSNIQVSVIYSMSNIINLQLHGYGEKKLRAIFLQSYEWLNSSLRFTSASQFKAWMSIGYVWWCIRKYRGWNNNVSNAIAWKKKELIMKQLPLHMNCFIAFSFFQNENSIKEKGCKTKLHKTNGLVPFEPIS